MWISDYILFCFKQVSVNNNSVTKMAEWSWLFLEIWSPPLIRRHDIVTRRGAENTDTCFLPLFCSHSLSDFFVFLQYTLEECKHLTLLAHAQFPDGMLCLRSERNPQAVGPVFPLLHCDIFLRCSIWQISAVHLLKSDGPVGNWRLPEDASIFGASKLTDSLFERWHEDKWAQAGCGEWCIMAIILP